MLMRPTHDMIFYVAANMREADRREIYGLYDVESPYIITEQVMAAPAYAWVAVREYPIAAFGAIRKRAGTWAAYCFATDEFPRVALEITRFLKTVVKPHLFESENARRIEADSRIEHHQAHKWLQLLGARSEGIRREYNKHGDDYVTFAMTLSDFRQEKRVTNATKAPTMDASGRNTPEVAAPVY